MYHFSDEDLEWMSPYEVGDTILFRSSEGVDTMTVERIKVRDEYLPFMANEASTEMNALGSITNKVKHNGESLSNDLVIVKETADRLRVDFIFYFRSHSQYDDTKEGFPFHKVTISDVEYDDAIIIDDKNSKTNVKNTMACEYFIWSKSQGLLQYKYLNGEVYTFYKKIAQEREF
jgi:hypothetical protein